MQMIWMILETMFLGSPTKKRSVLFHPEKENSMWMLNWLNINHFEYYEKFAYAQIETY